MATILITGGGRGIGLELCRQLSSGGHNVFTSVRSTTTELNELPVTVIEGIDISADDCGQRLANALAETQLDMVISNAGVLTRETLADMDFERILYQFKVNTVGPLRVIHALQNNIIDGGKIGIVTSRVGSIEDNGSGGIYGYRLSKAAANMLGVNLAHDLQHRRIAVALLHPGLVATEMTNRQGIKPAVAASGLINRMKELDMQNSGTFWHAEGYKLPW